MLLKEARYLIYISNKKTSTSKTQQALSAESIHKYDLKPRDLCFNICASHMLCSKTLGPVSEDEDSISTTITGPSEKRNRDKEMRARILPLW